MGEQQEVAPTPEEWSRLYAALAYVKEAEPWSWMTETDLFGVQDPEREQLGFVSVMGMHGEHYGISVYLGAEALYAFWGLQEADFSEEEESAKIAERLLEIPQLQASFEDRELLEQADRAVIKQLGLKFRGRQSWPWFRSFRPGFMPWFLTGSEARFLTYALEQLPEVALHFKENPALLEPAKNRRYQLYPQQEYLVRVSRQEAGKLIWDDRRVTVPPPKPTQIALAMDFELLEGLKRLPRSKQVLEIDLFVFPAAVGERGTRPCYPYMLMVVEAYNGMILGAELLQPLPSLETMWGSVPLQVVYQLTRARLVPKTIRASSPWLLQLLEPLAKELKISLKQADSLPALNAARGSLLTRFM